ncbi:MAG: hypoxanthine-guanine phosphoribosyltransferase [Gammaproteobacteria bacterium]|nr:MAG: hypoxanthine-guanine phosphoribosyltransferase [Gammaproteobacteria bacterium]
MIPATAELIYSRQDIERTLDRLAETLNREFAGQKPIVLVVMIGGMVTAGHLITRFEFDLELDYIHATRYRGGTRGQDVQWLAQPRLVLGDRPVLLVDDILDEGQTLVAAIRYCREQGARSVTTVVLVEKVHDRRHPDLVVDHVGLQVPDRYVFGYGMDYRGRLRHLPDIYAIDLEHEDETH